MSDSAPPQTADEPMATDDDSQRRGALRRLGVLRRIIGLLRPHRARFYLANLTLLVGSGLSLAYPQLARDAIDKGVAGGSLDHLEGVLYVLVVLFAAHAVLVWFRHYLMSWLGERVVTDLRRMVFDRLLSLPSAWFHSQRTGEIVGRLSSDVTRIESVVGSELSIALRNLVQLVGGIALLVVVSPRLTGLMLLVVPPVVLGGMVFGRYIRRMSQAVQDRLAEASGRVQETVGAMQTVQAFVRERHEAARYGEAIEGAFAQSLSLARWRATLFSAVTTLGYVAVAFVMYMGGRAIISGDVSAGDFTAFLIYTFMIAGALGSLAGLWGQLQRAAGATERLFGIIETEAVIRDPDNPRELPSGGGAVRFDGVSFSYDSRPDHEVLSEIDLDIAPGEVVALVGPSGAGKSTLISLLFRFFDPRRGAVRLEGVDLRELRLAELRGTMAIVHQEPVLFSGTIRDNIAYGREGASPQDVETAARDANAHEFIERFPDGYDTLVGERGVQLSGGQRQRVAIARALIANPRVLVLDEATSNLDAESEAQVQAALERLMEGRTTLVIAHRLSTVRDADRIVVLEHGRLVEQGPHDALMATSGVYRRLVEHQIIETPAAAAGA